MKKIILYIFLFATISAKLKAQCFAEVILDRHSVYAEQPFRVTINVLTSTFYTAPLEFDSLQIPGAYIIPFGQTRPGNFTINRKSYAGLTFYFIVFPYRPGQFEIPSFAIRATTPPPNSGVSRRITIKTKPVAFTVKDMPSSFKGTDWFVAKNVTISDHWNKSIKNLMTGDMVERTITINAYGTLPQFIPDIESPPADFNSVYPGETHLVDTRNDYDANGRLTQKFTYLMEKAGDFEFPSISLSWWNPYAERTFTKSLPGEKIHVKDNPNLGILSTIKDSLNKTSALTTPAKNAKHSQLEILGIKWYWVLTISIVAVLVLYWLVRTFIYVSKKIQQRYEIYIHSEHYLFNRFLRHRGDASGLIGKMYNWWSSTEYFYKTASISDYAKRHREISVQQELDKIFMSFYDSNANMISDVDVFKTSLKKFRQRLSERTANNAKRNISDDQMVWN